jgi:hypothetical protein
MNAALLASAEGNWPRASELLKGLLVADSENYVVSYWFYFAHQFMNWTNWLHRPLIIYQLRC